ncbi:MAG TPA: beta-L-arabinofuranosidase domain-containing protein [Tepidisphaeraceae bacterium]|nr:beta-L-arabinofuranosidase domain-containing protein [Tepidisphaeraceae bacterium]
MIRAVVVDTSKSPHAVLQPVAVNEVALGDAFWAPRRKINREKTIPQQYRQCESTGRIDNFRRASGHKKDPAFHGAYFNDSDVYKLLEAAAWTLATDKDAELEKLVDGLIAEIAAAQQSDGYIDTFFMFEKEKDRFKNLKDMHELYCQGHLIQAAVAHHRATGKTTLLDVAKKSADHICEYFGPKDSGKHEGVCGHPEIEMALMELARDTGDAKYQKQAEYFINARGRGLIGGSPYHQDHKPIREIDRMIGHAVRHVYLNCGATDLAMETGDEKLASSMKHVWDQMTSRLLYVTGGIGARSDGEAFGDDYELPNSRAYAETCAAVASIMWSYRMLLMTGEARYADLIEHTMYNGMLSGIALDGEHYYYVNPLENDGNHRRVPWFDCACCPPNVARMIASWPGYLYSTSKDTIWVHQYVKSSLGEKLAVDANFPWDGKVTIKPQAGRYALMLRIPGWVEHSSLKINGESQSIDLRPAMYARLDREWKSGDTVELDLPMKVRRLSPHPYIESCSGRVTVLRGPVVYCVEGPDQPKVDLRAVAIGEHAKFDEQWQPNILGGVVTLSTEDAYQLPHNSDVLYQVEPDNPAPSARVNLTAIPYYAWANREKGRMAVWIRQA